MANKLQIKRGTNLSNAGTPAEGELIYKTDTKKLYVGDGSTAASSLTPIGGASTSGSNNQVLTDNGSGGINSEGNLTFGGSHLKLLVDSGKYLAGADEDAYFMHSGSHMWLNNSTGNLYIRNQTTDGQIIFQTDNGSGGTTAYFTIKGNDGISRFLRNVRLNDSIQLQFGSNNDFSIQHDGSHNYMKLINGNLYFRDQSNNNIFQIYREGGGIQLSEGDFKMPTASKLYLDGGSDTYIHNPSGDTIDIVAGGQQMLRLFEGGTDYVHTDDNVRLGVGNDPDLVLYHTSGASFISNDTGMFTIRNTASNQDIRFTVNDGGSTTNILTLNAASSRVGINETSVDANLHVTGSPVVLKLERPGQRAIRMGTPDNSSQFVIADSDDLKSNQRYLIDNSGNHSIYGNTSFSSPMSVQYGATFNEGGHNSDFRVESQNQTHQLHVDASADIVKIVNLRDDRTHIGYTSGHGIEGDQLSEANWSSLPTGFHGMMRSGNQNYGNPGSTYFYFHKISQRDTAGGWGGIALGYANNAEFYVGHTQTNSSYATWSKVWNQANDGSGSGLDADLLDGVHASGFWQNSGTWNGANFNGSRHRGITINGGEISIQRDHPNNSQVSVLVDGGYSAGENNGFWSLYSGNSWNNRVGFYSDSGGDMIFNSTHATGDYSFKNNGTTRIQMTYDGQFKWGSGANFGTLTWDTGKAIITSQGSNDLEIRRVNSSDMIDFEENEMRFVADGTERMAVNQNGVDLSANSVNKILMPASSTRDKYRVWTSSAYAIGMQNSFTFGGLNSDYAMTFQMSNTASRGFWFGDNNHGQAGGAMAVTTEGKLTVAHSMRLGYGETDQTTPGSTFTMDISGNNNLRLASSADQMIRFARSGGNEVSIEHDTSQIYFYNRATSKAMFLMSNSGSVIMGYNSNPSLEIRNTATSAGSGGSLVFGHSQSGTNSQARISSYLVDGSQSGRAGHLRFWTRRAGTEELAMQLQHDNKLRLYQPGDTSDYGEMYVDDTRVHFHAASGNYHRFTTDSGYIELGPANSGWGHINTDRDKFYFNKKIIVDTGVVGSYDEDLSLRRNFNSSSGQDDRIDILDDSQRFYVGNTEEFRVDAFGVKTSGITRTDDYFQKNASAATGCLYKLVNSGWSNATTHDILYNHYQSTLGDYTYLKSAGNSANDHGIVVVADNYIFLGKDNLTTGNLDNSATAPITDVYMRVDSSGNGLFDGDVVAFSTTIASDARLKENVKDLNYGLKDVLDIRPVSFDWKEKRNGQHDIGVIAQEIEKIIPEVVVEVDTLNSEDTHKTVDYAKLTSVLIKAVQEQQQQINDLKEKLNG